MGTVNSIDAKDEVDEKVAIRNNIIEATKNIQGKAAKTEENKTKKENEEDVKPSTTKKTLMYKKEGDASELSPLKVSVRVSHDVQFTLVSDQEFKLSDVGTVVDDDSFPIDKVGKEKFHAVPCLVGNLMLLPIPIDALSPDVQVHPHRLPTHDLHGDDLPLQPQEVSDIDSHSSPFPVTD